VKFIISQDSFRGRVSEGSKARVRPHHDVQRARRGTAPDWSRPPSRDQHAHVMFHEIPEMTLSRMRELEEMDLRDRADGTPQMRRLRQIPREAGRFLALLAAAAPDGRCIEIGTSAGYSTLWLALACRATQRKITTFEILKEKVELARRTFAAAGVGDAVELVHGDALELLPACRNIAFCFLDGEKEVYERCYEAVVPRMVPGGMLVADNAISHQATLRPLLDRALRDERVDALIVPIGSGELICRRV
jgi:caffeoyl-CoA O-methyltransferase